METGRSAPSGARTLRLIQSTQTGLLASIICMLAQKNQSGGAAALQSCRRVVNNKSKKCSKLLMTFNVFKRVFIHIYRGKLTCR